MRGFEPPTFRTQNERATRLRYIPRVIGYRVGHDDASAYKKPMRGDCMAPAATGSAT